jgi:hypothetical protein
MRPAVVGRADVELLEERLHPLGTEPLDPHQVAQLSGHPRLYLGQQRQLAGLDDGLDLGGEIVADVRQLTQVGALRDELGHGLGMAAEGAGGIAIGAHPEGVGVVELEEVREALELRGDFRVVDGHDDRRSVRRPRMTAPEPDCFTLAPSIDRRPRADGRREQE